MPARSIGELLDGLLKTSSPAGVRQLLEQVGDYADVGLNKRFGPLNLCWRAYGDNPSNQSTIGLATKPGRSLAERVTNAIDAMLEYRAAGASSLPRSPRQAARTWFARPIPGPEESMVDWEQQSANDRWISVVLLPADQKTAPTADVIDCGVGLAPDQFPVTILSLQAGNKVTKPYLIGSFGQGGSSTLGFSEYTLIASRSHATPNTIGFTLIRVLSLSEGFKEDAYGYLCTCEGDSQGDGEPRIPRVEVSTPLSLYPNVDEAQVPTWAAGTLARHYGYKLSGLEGSLGPTPGNLYHFLHVVLFDPILPFRLIDLRVPKGKDELVTGSRNRLMRLAKKNPKDSDAEEKGSDLRRHRKMEFVTPLGSSDASIGIEYWVVLNFKKRGEERDLRANSSELYAQRGHPIVGTMNGQNQGELTAAVLRDVGLPMVARHIVVHIDASAAGNRIRRELFSTTREGFKEGDVLRDLTRVLEEMLKEDEELYALERQLTERLAKREAVGASEEVKRQVRKLLIDAGLEMKDPGSTAAPGEGQEDTTGRKKRRPSRRQDPLPTLPFPEVTKLEIVWPQPTLAIAANDMEVIACETDADAEFDRRGLIGLRFEPEGLRLVSKSPLAGGRMRWRVAVAAGTAAGTKGKAVVALTRPNGTQISATVPYEVMPPREEKSSRDKGLVPPFEIVGIHPHDNREDWAAAWPELSEEDVDPAELARVAYRVVPTVGKLIVFYSKVFTPWADQVTRLSARGDSSVLLAFKSEYEIWIGYHAILQDRMKVDSTRDEEELERLREAERACVASMQVKQAIRTAELLERLVKSGATADD